MRLLLKAAFQNRKHLYIILLTMFSLLSLTVASSLEMFAIGFITDTTTTHFAKEKESKQAVKFKDYSNHLKITKGSDQEKKSFENPLKIFLNKVKRKLNVNAWGLSTVVYLVVFITLFKAATLFFSRYFTQLLSIYISRDLRQKYFEHIQRLPMSFYQQYNIGTLSSRVVADAAQISVSFNSFLTNYFHTPIRVILTLGACFWISWQLSFVIFIGMPLLIFPVIFLTRKVKTITRQLFKNQEKFSSVLIDFLAGIQTVKIFAMERFSLKKYKEQNDRMALLEKRTAKYDLLIRPILHTVTVLCVVSILVFGLYVLKMTLAEILMFCGLLREFYEPVKKFSEENAIIQKGTVAAERLFEVMHIKTPYQKETVKQNPLYSFEKSIEFKKVWFRYDDSWILKDVSFTIEKGQTVAIVGSTGAGKSTIVQLLPRLYEIERGEICIDDRPISKISKQSLREFISFVPQKPFLFFDTIASNISYGKSIDLEKIQIAARKAHAEEFIECLPNRYDTVLSEMGKNLSGGQQQRLAIARALAKEAPILILDEATSSLDSVSELRIKEAIASLHGSVTQIIIAHRLSTIDHADKIIFLAKGEKIAEGTKDQLMEKCPEFKLMWQTHFLSRSDKSKKTLESLKP